MKDGLIGELAEQNAKLQEELERLNALVDYMTAAIEKSNKVTATEMAKLRVDDVSFKAMSALVSKAFDTLRTYASQDSWELVDDGLVFRGQPYYAPHTQAEQCMAAIAHTFEVLGTSDVKH